MQLALAETRKKPQADVHFNFSSLGFALFGGGGIANVLTSLLGLHVSVPMKEKALQENVAQAARNRDTLDDDLEFRRQQIVNEVRGQVRAETAKANIDLLTANLDVAKKSVHIAQRLIEEGLAPNRDLLDAQASQTDTESGVLSAKVDYFLTMDLAPAGDGAVAARLLRPAAFPGRLAAGAEPGPGRQGAPRLRGHATSLSIPPAFTSEAARPVARKNQP